MKRPFLRVTPGEESPIAGDIPDTITSLHKLTGNDSRSFLQRLNPFHSEPPLRFEFVAFSQGEDEPVEFYYGADDHLDALNQRLRSTYPSSYQVDRVEVDITKRLLRPVEYSREEFAERLEVGRLYHTLEQSADGRATVSDGGKAGVTSATSDAERQLSEEVDTSGASDTEGILDDIGLMRPHAVGEDRPLTALDGPTATADGGVYARPALSEVEPFGVEWWGAAARRKDWMTTLTGFTEALGQEIGLTGESAGQSRFPLSPLVRKLEEATQPLAFQAVFQRRSDWSRDARRRAGELLDGTDTLLQKILGLESSGARRSSDSGRNSHRSTRHTSRSSSSRRTRSRAHEGPAHPASVEEASRYDQVRANSPKRTFSVNLRLITLSVDGNGTEDLAATLDPLRSVFDLVDGQFYEIDGRRLRSKGYLPGAGERHARNVFDRFTQRSVVSGGRWVAITNRSETRPDLILNGDELANFIIVPPASQLSATEPAENSTGEPEQDEPKADDLETMDTTPASTSTPTVGQSVEATGGSISDAPNSVIHRDGELNQLAGVLEPITVGNQADTVLVTGPTGSGKTHTAKYAVDRLCQQHPRINAVYVNCWEDHSPYQTLYRILDELEGTLDIHRQSTPRDVLLDRLGDNDEQPGVIILDEVDQLDDKDILYDLINLPRFSLLLIVNQEEDLLHGLDDRLSSRLRGCERIEFSRYSVNQLVDILGEVAKETPLPRTVRKLELERIAEAVNGDARVAQTTLRMAARRVDDRPDDQITEDLVHRVLPEARQEVRRKSIEGLTPHQRAIFRIIEEHDRISPGELIEQYRKRVDDPKSNRTIRNYLNKLERYDLIEAEGTTRDRKYRCSLSR